MVEASCAEDKASRVVKDVIRGKGQGLIALLHGRPGTGKTLTSESIAELLKRPLYSISAGELGIEARSLERSLRDTLELAKSWRAVLLIDEADVILEARSQHEIQRNGLVSIFLRLLEYFEGVLILTTNRIKTFDEAALSRCSIAMRYPDLDLETRKAIWSKFLKLANVDVGKAQTNGVVENGAGRSHLTKAKLQEFASKSINGRGARLRDALRKADMRAEIKQVIRTAQA
jgi:SpoVK/Ycf46/Vps4 family AAA+-type ATPase